MLDAVTREARWVEVDAARGAMGADMGGGASGGSGGGEEVSLPTWAFARVHTAFRRTPPKEVVYRCTAARGRPAEDVLMAERMLHRLTTVVRDDHVRNVRQAIADDGYENALKIEVAVERLLGDLEGMPWR